MARRRISKRFPTASQSQTALAHAWRYLGTVRSQAMSKSTTLSWEIDSSENVPNAISQSLWLTAAVAVIKQRTNLATIELRRRASENIEVEV